MNEKPSHDTGQKVNKIPLRIHLVCFMSMTSITGPYHDVDQLLEPSKRNDKSLNQDNDLNKNCVSNSTLNPPNLNPKFPSLPKMRGFKIAFLNICSLTCHYDGLCVFMEDRIIDILKESLRHC